jgi:hypothetical protein
LGNGSIRSTCHIKILESGIMTFSTIFNSEAHPGSAPQPSRWLGMGEPDLSKAGSRIKPPVAI